jgi:hypothetical protein
MKIKAPQETSEPLAQTVYAVRGSVAAKVLELIEQKVAATRNRGELPKRLDINYITIDRLEDCEEGLIIKDDNLTIRPMTYSTRYVFDEEKGQYTVKVGDRLDARPCGLEQAADEYIAMLQRGVCTWKFKGRTTRSAYGMVARPKQHRSPLEVKQLLEERRSERRRLFMHEV